MTFIRLLALSVLMPPVIALANPAHETAWPDSNPTASARPAAPPDFPDALHVVNGCYLSSLAYLARFTALYPDERGEVIAINARLANEPRKFHSIAIMSWRGHWWGRDEYFGVFPVRLPVSPGITAERLQHRARSACENHAKALLSNRLIQVPAAPPRTLSPALRAANVEAAAEIIRLPSQVFHVRSGREVFPVLFFRPAPGCIAVYDPLKGTASAECDTTDDAVVVAAVVRRVGYRVDAVETPPEWNTSELVASRGD
jgi:hypothetical protein